MARTVMKEGGGRSQKSFLFSITWFGGDICDEPCEEEDGDNDKGGKEKDYDIVDEGRVRVS